MHGFATHARATQKGEGWYPSFLGSSYECLPARLPWAIRGTILSGTRVRYPACRHPDPLESLPAPGANLLSKSTEPP